MGRLWLSALATEELPQRTATGKCLASAGSAFPSASEQKQQTSAIWSCSAPTSAAKNLLLRLATACPAQAARVWLLAPSTRELGWLDHELADVVTHRSVQTIPWSLVIPAPGRSRSSAQACLIACRAAPEPSGHGPSVRAGTRQPWGDGPSEADICQTSSLELPLHTAGLCLCVAISILMDRAGGTGASLVPRTEAIEDPSCLSPLSHVLPWQCSSCSGKASWARSHSSEQQMGKGGLIEADLEMTEAERAQLDPLAGGVWRQQRSALELFCHANTWNITADMHLSPPVASLSAELHFPQQKMPFNSLAPSLHPSGGAFAGLGQRCRSLLS